ncbi:acetyl-CoA synthetase-like protein [Paraphaeosphaeria sporulosa]|uniref:Acetyl-CoA synthetase-like protein n=1 Tax=Paraphaeosphaeria sporulosa TaxID=1460663 RepID=A0A177CLQ2_9PLEO|nr:acetyl-CoA synthetase-like protein [Paraphaeosphaeria sporulosa]OAG08443.1 acetyl-CoA synthetase-like protein [Paraphaeosphaeria sporulosa]
MASSGEFQSISSLSAKDQILFTRFASGTTVIAPHDIVHEAFECQVDAHPASIAAKHDGSTITYADLDVQANRLANYLIERGLKPKQRVCLVVQRSFEMLVGIFAILKSGCQYVPMDGGVVSEEALQHTLRDTQASFVLALPKFESKVERCAPQGVRIVCLGTKQEVSAPSHRPVVPVSAGDGAYAIYTSGSTGKPKGVDVAHGNVTNALLLNPGKLGIVPGTKVGQVLNVSFDMGAWETLGCLMNGGTLCLRTSSWENTLEEIDVLISTPSILSKWNRSRFPNIKTVVTGGEPCPQSLADEWAAGTSYYNICGPTEITILNSAHLHTPGQFLTIGKPLPNTTVYILDEDENPVAIGEMGSMWVGGAGVTRGYINLPELTAKRYKMDKFRNDGSRMFNTGDLVRWREDGSLETFGRSDDQVKIKGFRVELDGVTAVVEAFPGVSRACAKVVNKRLHGFYAAEPGIDEQALDSFVRQHLPFYSVPERWIHVPEIPLTPNGKVDKKMLVELALSAAVSASTTGAVPIIAPPVPVVAAPARGVESCLDLEKAERYDSGVVRNSLSIIKGGTSSISESLESELDKLPGKKGFHGQRWLRHRAFILYRRFFSVVLLANIATACFILYRRVEQDRYILADVSTAFAANLCMAVLMRSEPVVNLLFTAACSVPTSWPLAIRRHCARVFHIGGIHSSCAIASVGWFTIFTVGASLELTKQPDLRCLSLAPTILTYLVWPILMAIAGTSHPTFRAKHHDIWEMTHRFGGWTALILLWVQSFLATKDLAVGVAPSRAYLTSPGIWLLSVATAAIIFPWLFLRKVPVRSEVLSDHAVRLHFDYTDPVVGTAVRLAERPLRDWHGFATITNADGRGFSLVVSNAGDFTKRTINRAPTHIWVRGIPTCGVLRIAPLFRSVVLVATGSGIGPCLAVILAKKVPCRILWTAPNHEKTFGKDLVNEVLDTDPRAVIHNTRTMGKPDMPLMAWKLYKESGAEAVCVISNKRFTQQIVYAMESRGVPAYGAIFDS